MLALDVRVHMNGSHMSSLMPPGDDEFDRGPRTPPQSDSPSGYNRDFARAEDDRGSYGLTSAAYWVVRGVQELFRLARGK